MAKKDSGNDRRIGNERRKVRVKTAKSRSASSARWLRRQLNDPYVARAKQDGYRSRAAYKLMEMDDKFRFLKPGLQVVDLGAAPGSWSQVAAERMRGMGRIVAIDIIDMVTLTGVEFIQGDFLQEEPYRMLLEKLGDRKADIVLSDMAANASGHTQTDHIRIMALCEAALDFALKTLAPDGVFIAKVLRGGTEGKLLREMRKYFSAIRHFKPGASRSDSAEMYVIATGFRQF